MHTEAHLFSVPNDCLWYDKLWGPSQRVVTLLSDSHFSGHITTALRTPMCVNKNVPNSPILQYVSNKAGAQRFQTDSERHITSAGQGVIYVCSLEMERMDIRYEY